MSELAIEQVSKSFQRIPAVVNLNVQVKSGEVFSVLGPSGCGKSTTLQMIAGIVTPDRGRIRLAGRDLARVPPEKRGIALVLQRGLLFPHLSVGENVAFGLKMRGQNRADREAKAVQMLEQVRLPGFAERQPQALSGGQAQRVALARALVIQPQVLLLDEPLSALDANLRSEMQSLILDLQSQMGITTVIVTHDQAEAVALSDRIGLMLNGSLCQIGSPADFYRQPATEAVARFFGGVNFWLAEANHTRLELASGSILTTDHPTYGSVVVTIRPEQVQVATERNLRVNAFSMQVVSSRFAGTQCRLVLEGSGIRVQAWVPPNASFGLGQQVWAWLPPDCLWCLPIDGSQVARVVNCDCLTT